MKKSVYLALALCFAPLCAVAQDAQDAQQLPAEGSEQQRPMPPMGGGRPSTYDQTTALRQQLSLTDKQFDKVYQAYSKYNKAVFGEEFESSSSSPFGGGMPSGGPGGGMGGPGGGMGGPGGGMGGPGGGMGGPGGGMGGPGMGGGRPDMGSSSSSSAHKDGGPKQLSEKEIAKLQKTITKQEEKLQKSMKKILKSDDLYNQWLTIRQKEQTKPQMGPRPQPTE
jgi:hypothetical protein